MLTKHSFKYGHTKVTQCKWVREDGEKLKGLGGFQEEGVFELRLEGGSTSREWRGGGSPVVWDAGQAHVPGGCGLGRGGAGARGQEVGADDKAGRGLTVQAREFQAWHLDFTP